MDRLTTWLRAEPDRAAGWAMVSIGAQLLLLTYLSIDSEPVIVSQLAFLVSGGLGGMLLLGVGLAVLVLADLADEWHKLDRIEATLDRRTAPATRPGLLALPPVLRRPLVASLIGLGLGVGVLVLAWNRAANVDDPKDGFRAVGLGVGGLIVGGTAVAMGTFWFLRVVRLRSSRLFAPWLLEDLQSRMAAGPASSGTRQPVLGSTAPTPAAVLVGTGLRRFHLPSCAAVAAGGPYATVALADVPAGLTACGLCLPDLLPAGATSVPVFAAPSLLEGATSR